MHIDSYISDLLYRYDCVTMPGFGAFLTTRVSAKVHETTNSFYPPKKVLSFNEQVHHNDGLLCSYIADVEKIPYESAVKKLNKHVKAIKAYLVEGETITFIFPSYKAYGYYGDQNKIGRNMPISTKVTLLEIEESKNETKIEQ